MIVRKSRFLANYSYADAYLRVEAKLLRAGQDEEISRCLVRISQEATQL